MTLTWQPSVNVNLKDTVGTSSDASHMQTGSGSSFTTSGLCNKCRAILFGLLQIIKLEVITYGSVHDWSWETSLTAKYLGFVTSILHRGETNGVGYKMVPQYVQDLVNTVPHSPDGKIVTILKLKQFSIIILPRPSFQIFA